MKRDPSSERDDIQEGLAERDAEQRDADREVAKDIARAFGADLDGGRDDEERRNWGDWLDARDGWIDADFAEETPLRARRPRPITCPTGT